MSFSFIQVIFTGFISFLVGGLLKFIEPKAKLVYWFPHSFIFNLKKEGVTLQTNSFTIQNMGRKCAESIEIIHKDQPDFFELYPAVNYTTEIKDNGHHVIKVPFLGSKEFITLQLLSYKTVPQILSVRSKDSPAMQIPITMQRVFPKWIQLLFLVLMIIGVITVISLVTYLIPFSQILDMIEVPK